MGIILALLSLVLSGISHCANAADDSSATEKNPRFALLIGNTNYMQIQADNTVVGTLRNLRNPCNDVMTIGAQLQRIGWDEKDISIRCNLMKSDISAEIDRFIQRFSYAEAPVGLIYFSGHGVQVRDRNYVFGVAASPDIKKAASLSVANPRAKLFVSDAEDIGHKLVADIGEVLDGALLVVLDACRDNPLIDEIILSGSKSISRPQTSKTLPGIVFSFATTGGAVANDGFGDNSPFAEALADSIQAGESIDDVLSVASTRVYDTTKGLSWEQIPDKTGYFRQPPKRCFSGCSVPASGPKDPVAEVGSLPGQKSPIAGYLKLPPRMRKVGYVADETNHHYISADYVVAQSPDTRANSEATKEFVPPRVIYERDSYLSSKQPLSTVNVDVFWCDGDDLADSRRILAAEVGAATGVIAKMTTSRSGSAVKRVRSRALPAEVNSQADYQYSGNIIRFDSDSPAATEWAREIALVSPVPLTALRSRASVPNYISIFLCGNNDLMARPGRVYFQLAYPMQEKPARSAIADIRANMTNISVAEGLDIQPKISPNKTEVRYFSKGDKETAATIAEAVARKTGEPVDVRNFERLGNSSNNGTFEVWLGKDFKSIPSSR